MLNIRTRDGISMERFDVEDMCDDIHIQPKTSAYIRRLDEACQKMRSRKDREDLPP